MGTELVLPQGFAAPSKLFAQAGIDVTRSLSEGIGQSYPVLGYKGGRWSLRYRGERYNFIRPDDGTPLTYLDVIILDAAAHKSKSFYKKFDPSGGSEGERPLCASINGIRPDPDVQEKQADACALCPRNEFKMLTRDDGSTRRGKECQDYKRLAVLILPPLTALLFQGTPLMEPVFLRVPPGSLNSLALMGDGMQAKGYFWANYITRITFNPEVSWPEMVFTPIRGLPEPEVAALLGIIKANKGTLDRITGGEIVLEAPGTTTILPPQHSASAADPPSPVLTTAPPTTIIAPQPASGAAPAASPSSLAARPASAPSAMPVIELPSTPVAPAASPAPAPSPPAASARPATASPPPVSMPLNGTTEQTGLFAGVMTASPAPPAAPQAAQQTAADTGEAAQSDADLDAQIMALVQKK